MEDTSIQPNPIQPNSSNPFHIYQSTSLVDLAEGQKNIRLLNVYPLSASEEVGDPIKCDMSVVNLASQHQPTFSALTYVWGADPDGTHSVLFKETRLGISTNCHAALQHLRRKLGRFTIWVDAICINQNDEREKMSQIPLMGDIFSKAATVYVWLGEGDAASNRAMKYLETAGFTNHFRDSDGSGRLRPRVWAALGAVMRARISLTRHPFPLRKQRPSWLSRQISAKAPYASYEDLGSVLGRPWIKRLWTFQEILLASNPVVICGDYHLPWSRFVLSIIFLEFSGLNHMAEDTILHNLGDWAEVALFRDRLIASKDPASNDSSGAGLGCVEHNNATKLTRYRRFVTDVGERMVRCRCVLYAFISGFEFLFIALCFVTPILGGTMVATKVNPKYDPPPSSLISSANQTISLIMACIRICTVSSPAQCYAACNNATSASQNMQIDIQHMQVYSKGIDLRALIGIAGFWGSLLFVLITFLALILWFRRYPRFQPIYHSSSIKFDLVNGLCTRKSREPEDKAFALQSVLQRLSNMSLPAPDSTRSLEEIYKELTIRIIEITGSLELLTRAGLSNFSGYPSWIPNWAADFDSIWTSSHLSTGQRSDASPGSTSCWKWLPSNSNILSVQGRHLCTIIHSYKFQSTMDTYSPHERDIHLKNIETMLTFWDSFQRKRYIRSNDSFIWNAKTEVGFPPNIKSKHLQAWSTFFNFMRGTDPEFVLSLLENNRSKTVFSSRIWCQSNGARHFSFRGFFLGLPQVFPTIFTPTNLEGILNTQVAICNGIAQTKRSIFSTNDISGSQTSASFSGASFFDRLLSIELTGDNRWFAYAKQSKAKYQTSEEEDYSLKWDSCMAGIGSEDVQVGDKIVLIAGVSFPLVIRYNMSSTRVISPAIVEGVMEGQAWNPDWKFHEFEEFLLS